MLLERQAFKDEIHLKIGGDHGGGSFKMSYQPCNVTKPNSKDNTVVFSAFEAKDSSTNLKVALSKFKTQVDILQKATWQYVIHLFSCIL